MTLTAMQPWASKDYDNSVMGEPLTERVPDGRGLTKRPKGNVRFYRRTGGTEGEHAACAVPTTVLLTRTASFSTPAGRGIVYTRAVVGGRPLVVGTTHLESPVGKGPQQMTAQRREQLGTALKELQAAAGPTTDCVLAGGWAVVTGCAGVVSSRVLVSSHQRPRKALQ